MDEKYEEARKQVSILKGFYIHLAIYLAVMILLFYIDYSDRGNWWVQWPAIGWGIAILVQGLSVGFFNPTWEEKKIKKIMEKDKE